MAALVAGVQYGLSSHSNFHENKSLIFVKLTDSAQRAIEDYLRNRNKINQNPTIQFLGNEGQLSFPSAKSSHGNFTFSLSSNQDIEGPQGGFECVQQTGPKNLESLGTLPCKMRIQANDDVYETTRHRMHAAEESNKNKCTRVIKANEPIGRKVKVKGSVRMNPSPVQANSVTVSRQREPSNFTTSVSQSSRSSQKPNSSQSTTNRIQSDVQKKLTDIMRRPLRERLIHLLALRPFKRPELYDRINREGIREKEKTVMATALKSIAFMRDNTYHLMRCVWNDVQEDWPFYTEQEKAMLKRRKPQNLTPPGSSDGSSSGSGQSPNSTHPGSPTAITAPPPGLLGSKRPGYYQGNDGLPTKRQRISHYRKPEPSYSTNPADCGRSNFSNGTTSSCDQKQQQQPQQQHRQQQQAQRNRNFSAKSELTSISDSEDINTVNKSNGSSDSLPNNRANHNLHSNLNYNGHYYHQQQHRQEQEKHQKHSASSRKIVKSNDENNLGTTRMEYGGVNAEYACSPAQPVTQRGSEDKDCKDRVGEQYAAVELNYSLGTSSSPKTSSHSENNSVGDSFISFSTSPCNRVSPVSSENFHHSDHPDYLTEYTVITSSEQRTRYKAEFNAYYKEYRKLHVQVVKISKQFSQLEEELKEKSVTGNTEGYEAIKHEILDEYARTKNINARFYYLHDKLGHIKKLVSDYDAQNHSDSDACNKNSQMISSPDLDSDTFNHNVSDTRCALIQLPVEQPKPCPSKLPRIS